MPSRMRSLALFLLAALAATVLAACGGDDATPSAGKKASGSTDAKEVLKDTFAGETKITSGKVELSLRVDAEGIPGATGPIDVKLSGPFQSQGQGKVPKLDMDLAVSGTGQDIKAGVVSTGDKGYVEYAGKTYVASDAAFKQFVAGYEEAQKQAGTADGKAPSLGALGIDPSAWLIDPVNGGETKVGDADVVKVSGGIDVDKLLDDVDTALAKAGSLGVPNAGSLPQKLTAAQRKQVKAAVKDPKIELYPGTEDKILRRLVLDTTIAPPASAGGSKGQQAAIKLDVKVLELNEDQEIKAPANAKPLDELLSQAGGLGALGALGGGGAKPTTPGASGASNAEQQKKLKAYTDCVEKAGSDTKQAQACAKALQP